MNDGAPDGPAGRPGPCTLVLVHGSGNTSRTWDPVVAGLARPVLAVDLPGRRYRPADLTLGTVEGSAATVVAAVRAARLGPVVLVGHSAGGLILPAVAAQLGRQVRHLLFVAALIAAHGQPVIEHRGARRHLGLRRLAGRLARPVGGPTYSGLRPGRKRRDHHDLSLIEDSG